MLIPFDVVVKIINYLPPDESIKFSRLNKKFYKIFSLHSRYHEFNRENSIMRFHLRQLTCKEFNYTYLSELLKNKVVNQKFFRYFHNLQDLHLYGYYIIKEPISYYKFALWYSTYGKNVKYINWDYADYLRDKNYFDIFKDVFSFDFIIQNINYFPSGFFAKCSCINELIEYICYCIKNSIATSRAEIILTACITNKYLSKYNIKRILWVNCFTVINLLQLDYFDDIKDECSEIQFILNPALDDQKIHFLYNQYVKILSCVNLRCDDLDVLICLFKALYKIVAPDAIEFNISNRINEELIKNPNLTVDFIKKHNLKNWNTKYFQRYNYDVISYLRGMYVNIPNEIRYHKSTIYSFLTDRVVFTREIRYSLKVLSVENVEKSNFELLSLARYFC